MLVVPVPLGLPLPMFPELPFFSPQLSEIILTFETLKVFSDFPLDAAELFDPPPLSHMPFTATSWPA